MPWGPWLPAATSKNRWCSLSNREHYTKLDSAGLKGWNYDGRKGHGWRWCNVAVDECKSACIQNGHCAEIYYTENRCCFPSKSQCTGDSQPGGSGSLAGKYVLRNADKSPPPPQEQVADASRNEQSDISLIIPSLALFIAIFFCLHARRLFRSRKRHRYTRIPLRELAGDRAESRGAQIGRASCRERV